MCEPRNPGAAHAQRFCLVVEGFPPKQVSAICLAAVSTRHRRTAPSRSVLNDVSLVGELNRELIRLLVFQHLTLFLFPKFCPCIIYLFF